MKRKNLRIVGEQKDRLIVGLQVHEMIEQINLAMKVRKIQLTINYSDHYPKLYIEMPGVPMEGWMVLNTRTKLCVRNHPGHPDLSAAVNDIFERLAKFDSTLVLVADVTRTGKRCAKLQIRVGGSRTIALTIFEATRGEVIRDNHFVIPGVNT